MDTSRITTHATTDLVYVFKHYWKFFEKLYTEFMNIKVDYTNPMGAKVVIETATGAECTCEMELHEERDDPNERDDGEVTHKVTDMVFRTVHAMEDDLKDVLSVRVDLSMTDDSKPGFTIRIQDNGWTITPLPREMYIPRPNKEPVEELTDWARAHTVHERIYPNVIVSEQVVDFSGFPKGKSAQNDPDDCPTGQSVEELMRSFEEVAKQLGNSTSANTMEIKRGTETPEDQSEQKGLSFEERFARIQKRILMNAVETKRNTKIPDTSEAVPYTRQGYYYTVALAYESLERAKQITSDMFEKFIESVRKRFPVKIHMPTIIHTEKPFGYGMEFTQTDESDDKRPFLVTYQVPGYLIRVLELFNEMFDHLTEKVKKETGIVLYKPTQLKVEISDGRKLLVSTYLKRSA